MTQVFEDVEATTTLKDSREDLLDRDNAARTMNSGTSLPDVTDETYENMIGMAVFKTDDLVNQQLTEYETSTSEATWTPMVSGPVSAVDGNLASFYETTGGRIQDSGKVTPSGDIVGITDTQVLTNKTLSSLTTDLAIAEGGTSASAKTAAFDALAPTTTKGDLISSDGTNNVRVGIGTDDQVLSLSSSGLAWAAQGSGGAAGGLTLQTKSADFTMENGKSYLITSSSSISVTFPASASVGDRFAVISGASDDVSIMTNASATSQTLIGAGGLESVSSSSSSKKCGAIGEKMIYVEFSAISSTKFIGYVNYVVVVNHLAGYTTGGVNGVTLTDVIEKLIFSTDLNSTITSSLSVAKRSSAGYGSASAGYTVGGVISANTDVIEKLIFSSDVNSTISSTLSVAKQSPSGFASALAGYAAGGNSATTAIEKLIFSSDSNSTISAVLSSAKWSSTGFAGELAGYTTGGYPSNALIEKLIFSTDSNSAISATLSTSKYSSAGYSSSSAGYTVGGHATASTDVIEKLIFSSDTNSTISAVLSVVKKTSAGFAGALAGYITGGLDITDVIEKLTFSTDSNSAISATLSNDKQGSVGFND